VPEPRQPEVATTSPDAVAVPSAVQRIVITGDDIEFQGADGAILGKQTRTTPVVQLELPATSPGTSDALSQLINEAQAALVHNVSSALKSSMRRIGSAFNVHLAMSIAMFIVGLGSFCLAAWKGLNNPGQADAIIGVAFGGLSAAAFITYFVRMPLDDVASAGPEMAWLLGIVNTYWTKLVYMNDQKTFVSEIQKAQLEFEKSMCLLLKTTDSLERGEAPDSGESAQAGTPTEAPADAKPEAKTAATKLAASPAGGSR